ncbi:MAG: SMP-30/gluconolactonase/LRE family protein [Caldilineaceae bacterium]|nr:SMP-30/gluconolactonase/LRE family protein [Caldilineaceae bacterium]
MSEFDAKVELLVDIRALVGEGPIWDATKGVLYWVDILSSMVYEYDPATGENRGYHVGQHVGTVVPRASGGLMLALYDGFAAFEPATGAITLLADPEADLPGNRFNDGKCDPAGRFWAGTMAYQDQSTQGSLYRMDADHSVHKMLGDIGISNGIVWSLDRKTMYYIDSMVNTVRAFDYDDASGAIGNGRVIIRTDGLGLPDGMAIDAEGMLWVAHFGGSAVRRWHPATGEVMATIPLPASQITACAFGGPDLATLYITSAANGFDAAALAREPLAGSLFATKPGVKGVPTFAFAG